MRKRSRCASGSGYTPSLSIGFCVASTRNGVGHRVGDAADRHVALGHHLEQRRLHLGRGPVDLVGQHDVGEDRPELDVERLLRRPVDAGADEVGGHEVGRELDAGERCRRGCAATVSAASVLARPGAPSSRQWPRASQQTKSRSIMRSWPTSTRLASNSAASRTSSTGERWPADGRRGAAAVDGLSSGEWSVSMDAFSLGQVGQPTRAAQAIARSGSRSALVVRPSSRSEVKATAEKPGRSPRMPRRGFPAHG